MTPYFGIMDPHRPHRRDVLLGLTGWLGVSLVGCGKDATATASDASAPAPNEADAGAAPSSTGDYVPPNDSDAWETADAAANGWSPAGLDALVSVVEANHSSSFMMLVDGRILVEKYFLNAKPTTRTDVASVQKSFTSTLMGLARDRDSDRAR